VIPKDIQTSPLAVRKTDTSELKRRAGLRPYETRLTRMKKSGATYKAVCPFHGDRNPSLSLYEDGDEWHFKCFGSGCDASGDVIAFVMKKDRVEFPEALRCIADECHLTKRNQLRTLKASSVDDRPLLLQPRIDFNQEKASAALAESQAALDYLATRGISKEVALRHGLGFFDFPGLGSCIAIPYPEGHVKFRAIAPRDKSQKFRALGKPNDNLYGIDSVDNFSSPTKVLIVESELDQITASEHLDPDEFAVVSISSATASLSGGELKLRPDHIDRLKKFRGNIFIATDQDAALRVLPPAITTRVRWKGAKDVGELFTNFGQTFAEKIRQLCNESLIPPLWGKAAPFATLPEKKFEWIVADLIPADGITVVTGDFGSFKTYVSYFLADAIAGGGKFVDRPCQKHTVLFLDRENSHSTVYLRRSLVGDLKTRDNVRILGLFTDPSAPEVVDPGLLAICAQVKPVIIIDSLTDFHPGLRESDPDDMTECFRQIRNLVTAGAAAVVVLHHVPKNGNGRAGQYRGSTSIPAAGSNALVIQKSGKNKATIKGFKTRDGADQSIELMLSFSAHAVTYEVIKSGRDPDAELGDQIEEYVQENDGCSANDVVNALGKRKHTVLVKIEEMLRTGRLRRGPDGGLHTGLLGLS
jgi:AAA domain/CHC2 zinc finger